MSNGQPRRSRTWLHHQVIAYTLVGLVAVDIAVAMHREVWTTYAPDDYLERLNGCRRTLCDAVLVGGSSVSEGIDPSVLAGLRHHGQTLSHPYNLGLPGATTSEVWHAVEHGLTVPPRIIVYGVAASDLNDARQEPHGPQSLMDVSDLFVWLRSSPASAEWVTRKFVEGQTARLWNLFYYRNGIRLWAAATLDERWPSACPDVAAEARTNLRYTAAMRGGNGFAPRPNSQSGRLDRLKAAGVLPATFPFLEGYRLNGGHLGYVSRLLDWAAAAGVEVVLVDMPMSVDLEERMYPDAFIAYRRALATLVESRGLTLLRATRDAVGLGDADFADLIHLNAQGVARMSTWLRQALEDRA